MSLWSSVEGTVNLRRDAHISLRKVIDTSFDDYRKPFIEELQGLAATAIYSITVEWCNDGDGAVRDVKHFINKLKILDRYATVRLKLTTEFY